MSYMNACTRRSGRDIMPCRTAYTMRRSLRKAVQLVQARRLPLCSFYRRRVLYTVLYLCGCSQPTHNEWRLSRLLALAKVCIITDAAATLGPYDSVHKRVESDVSMLLYCVYVELYPDLNMA
ncbi:hypothetical protein BDV12DRAFT_163114, partial [Aspergillus spectabilis]